MRRAKSSYLDDLALLTNTPALDKSQRRSLEQATRGICLYVNANKTKFICFKQNGIISTLSGKLLKLVGHFTYFGNNNLRWRGILLTGLSIIQQSDKIKRDFFKALVVSIIRHGCITGMLTNCIEQNRG